MTANETSDQTLHIKQHNVQYKKADETSDQTLHRKQQNRQHMATMRTYKKTNDMSIQRAIISFHSHIKLT